MSACKVCDEKDKMIELEKERVEAILAGYEKDKKYYRRVMKILAITTGILVLELIFALAYGSEGILLALELIKGVFK